MKDHDMFSVGSWVVYPSHGVGKLDGIEEFEVAGETIKFFIISFQKTNLTLKVPIKKALESGLRKILTHEQMESALEVLSQKSKKKRIMWSKRAQEYENKINSGDPSSIAEVLRELYKEGGDALQSFSERQIFQNAMDRLSRELAVLENIDEESAVQKLEKILQAA